MKYIIMADGKGTRWQNYNDIPKHFIEINGETLLQRTVRLISACNCGEIDCDCSELKRDNRLESGCSVENYKEGNCDCSELKRDNRFESGCSVENYKEGNCDCSEVEHDNRFESGCSVERDEVIITSHDPRYEVEGARRYEPLNNVLEVDRFTEELIEDDICFLYGDTYYSEETMKVIMETEVEDVMFFGNQKSIVAVKIKDGELFKSHVDRVRDLFKAGEIKNCKGWQVYRSFAGLDVGADDYREISEKFITVDNKTDDFNTPEDFEGKVNTGI